MSAENISYDLQRFAGIKRDYTPEEVERLRGSIKIEYSMCKMQSQKLWKLLNTEAYVNTLGSLSGNMNVLEEVINTLFYIAEADGHVSDNELMMIEDIARIFGLNQTKINGIKESRKSSDKLNPYIVLESKPDDSLEEIRKRYIKLSKEHHPDLLLSKGVPQEVIDESKAKMRAVNSAWDQIQKLKN